MMSNVLSGIAQWVIAVLIGVILDRWAAPAVKRRLDSFAVKRAQNRATAKPTPDPPAGFKKYRLGNIEIPAMILFGTRLEPLSMADVTINWEPRMVEEEQHYPKDLSEATSYLTKSNLADHPGEHANDPLARLSRYKQAGETADNKRGKVTLDFQRTYFFNFLATNRSLDRAVIPELGVVDRFTRNRTLRETYVIFPYELEKSVLANPLSTHVVVISRNLDQRPEEQVLIRQRSQQVALYRGYYQAAAAGFVAEAHKDELDQPNSFVTAVHEVREEISDKLNLRPSEFKMIGLAVNWKDLDLNTFGYIETGLSVGELEGDFRRDAYEGFIEAIPFTPNNVLRHISLNLWEAIGALAMCATLLAKFGTQAVEEEARRVPAKTWRAF